MASFRTKTVSFALLILLPYAGWCQVNGLPIPEWKSKLSLKNDPGNQEFMKVYQAIAALDSVSCCETLIDLKTHIHGENDRFHIRVCLVRAYLRDRIPKCPAAENLKQDLEVSLTKAYEIEDPFLAILLYDALSNLADQFDDHNLSVTDALMSLDLMNKVGVEKFDNMALKLFQVGDKLYHLKDYRGALTQNLLSLAYHGRGPNNLSDSLLPYQKMNAWNEAGICYKRLAVYDSAFLAFHQALRYTPASGPDQDFWYGLIQGNRGDVFFQQGQYDSAWALLQLDFEHSMATHYYDNAAMSLQRLARIKNLSGDHLTALHMLQKADSLLHLWPNYEYRNALMQEYAMVYKDLGKVDSVYTYLDAYRTGMMASEKEVARNKMDIIRLQMNNQENVHHILQLNRDKSRIRLIRNFIIILILMVAAGVILYVNRQRLQMRLRQQEALERERIAAADATSAREQLKVFTRHMIEKSNLVENLHAQLLHKELANELNNSESELVQFTILTDDDWEKFKSLFESVHPGFFATLKSKAPDITLAELRMAALCKLQVPARKAATILGISPNSAHKNRQRLRNRLGLESDGELDHYLVFGIKQPPTHI